MKTNFYGTEKETVRLDFNSIFKYSREIAGK